MRFFLLLVVGLLSMLVLASAEEPNEKDFVSRLRNGNVEVRLQALQTLQREGGAVMPDEVIFLLKDNDARISSAAQSLLLKQGAKAVGPLCVAVGAMAREPDQLIGIGGVPKGDDFPPLPPDAKGLLIAFKAGDEQRRSQVVHALHFSRNAAKEAVPTLAEVLPQSKWKLASEILYLFRWLGPDAKDALPSIVPLLKAEPPAPAEGKVAVGNAPIVAREAAYAVCYVDPACTAAEDASKVIVKDLLCPDSLGSHNEASAALERLGARALPTLIAAYKETEPGPE